MDKTIEVQHKKQMGIHDLVAACALRHPDRDCLVFDIGKGEAKEQPRVTYSQLWQEVTELKNVFENLSVKEQIVGVFLADNISIPSVLIGLLSSSCAFYPFYLEGLQYTIKALAKVKVSWILTYSEQTQKLSQLLSQIDAPHIPSDILSKKGLQLFKIKQTLTQGVSPVKCCDLAYFITTSGTTGTPKVVHVPHSCIVPNITDIREKLQFGVNDKVILTSPLTFDPSVVDIFCTLSSGACLVIVPNEAKLRPELLLNILHHRQAITVMQATPTLVRSFSPSKLKQTLLGPNSSLRVLALGGEKFPSLEDVRGWIHEENKTKFYNLYGITEVSCWASMQFVNVRADQYQVEPVSIGLPLDQTVIKLMSTDGKNNEVVGVEEEGEICIGSAQRICFIDDEVYEKYADENCPMTDEKEPEVLWRNTGDIGKIMSNGNIICLGRKDDQVKRHGKRLNLNVIENVCKEVPDVVDCCAVLDQSNLMVFIKTESSTSQNFENNVEDNITSEIKAQMISTHNDNYKNEQGFQKQHTSWAYLQNKLKSHIEMSLPSHYKPTILVNINGTFPRTQNGKLDKRLLVSIGNSELRASSQAELTDVFSYSQDLWKNFLPDASVFINKTDNFISLGGDSLSAIRVINTLEHVFKISLPYLLDVLINKDFSCFVEVLQQQLNLRPSNMPFESQSEPQQYLDSKISDNFQKSLLQLQEYEDLYKTEKLWKPPPDPQLHLNFNHQNSLLSSSSQLQQYINSKSQNNLLKSPALRMTEKTRDNHNHIQEHLPDNLMTEKLQNHENVNHGIKRGMSNELDKDVQSDMSEQNVQSNVINKKRKLSDVTRTEDKNIRPINNGLNSGISSVQSYGTYNMPYSKSSNKEIIHSRDNSNSLSNCHIWPNKLIMSSNLRRIISRGKVWLNPGFNKVHSGKIVDLNNVSCSCDINNVKMGSLDDSGWLLHEQTCNHRMRTSCDVKLKWKFDTKKCVDASPLIVEFNDKMLAFIGSHSGQFSAINVINGRPEWTVILPDRIESSACCSLCGDYIIVGCYDGIIYVFNIDNGSIAWTFATGDMVKCSPVVDETNGYIVCGSHDGFLYCLDVGIKRCVWKCYMRGGSVFSSPVIDVSLNTVYAATLAGEMYCIHKDSGRIKWTFSLQKPVFSSLCLLDHSILAACVDGKLYCISSSGQIEWTFQSQDPIFSSPVVHNSTILFGSHDHHLYCLNKDGLQMWAFQASSPVFSTPFASSLLYTTISPQSPINETRFASMFIKIVKSPSVLVSDSQNQTSSSQKLPPRCQAQILCDLIITASTSGTIYLLNLENGHVLNASQLPNEIFSSPVVVNNYLVIGCRDNFVYCYEIT